MITVNEVGSGIFGAYRLACRDPGGMAFFDRSREGAIKSFYAAGILLPFYTLIVVTRWWEHAATLSPARILVIETLAYVIVWTAFPVLMISVTKWIDRTDRFFDLVVAINWASVVGMAVRFPIIMLQRLELLPLPVMEMTAFVVVVVLLVYAWFVIKTALDVNGGLAGGLAAADFVLGVLVGQVAYAIIKGDA